jgi:hypothetical protein
VPGPLDRHLWQVLLDAKDFGAGARLLAMGGQAVLVALGNGTFKIARLRDPSADPASTPPYSSWEFPSAGVEPIAIIEGRLSDIAPVPPKALMVVTCDPARTQCSLWRRELTQDNPGAWQETALPSGLVPRGVALDAGIEPRKVCVYGNGIYCLDGTWQEAIALSADLRINAVAFGAQWSLAVGEHGRWFKRERTDAGELKTWLEQAPLGDVALTQVSVAGGGGVIIGQAGFQTAVGEQAALYDCAASSELVALLLDRNLRGLAYAVTSTGNVIQHALVTPSRAQAYCAFQQLQLPGPVLDSGSVPCQQAMNPRVLTDQALFGTSLCLSIF